MEPLNGTSASGAMPWLYEQPGLADAFQGDLALSVSGLASVVNLASLPHDPIMPID